MPKVIVAIILAGALTIVLIAVLRAATYSVNTTINMASSGVLTEGEGLTVNVQSVDWGTLGPTQNATRTIEATNHLNLPMSLTILTSNWQPQIASEYLTLTWNYNSALTNYETRPINITLTVAENATGFENFSFDITVTGTY
jgi:hypothetical protein